jgi:hypothetical protein
MADLQQLPLPSPKKNIDELIKEAQANVHYVTFDVYDAAKRKWIFYEVAGANHVPAGFKIEFIIEYEMLARHDEPTIDTQGEISWLLTSDENEHDKGAGFDVCINGVQYPLWHRFLTPFTHTPDKSIYYCRLPFGRFEFKYTILHALFMAKYPPHLKAKTGDDKPKSTSKNAREGCTVAPVCNVM